MEHSSNNCISIPDLIEAVGEEMTAALLLKLGGSSICFPAKRTSEGAVVVQAIGEEAALVLGRHFGNTNWRIPIGSKFLARHLRAKGCSIQEIARTIRRSDVSVRAYLKPDVPENKGKLEAAAARYEAAARRLRKKAGKAPR